MEDKRKKPAYVEKEEKTKAERHKAEQHADRQEIIGALRRIAEQDQAAHYEAERDKQLRRIIEKLTFRLEGRKYWLEVVGTAGLWTAALVGLAAVIVASHDAHKQYSAMGDQQTVMQGQLKEMKSSGVQAQQLIEANQQLAAAAKIQADAASVGNRAWISPRFFSIVGQVKDGELITVRTLYDNPGRTPALNVEFHARGVAINSIDGRPLAPSAYRNAKLGENVACERPNTSSLAGVVYPSSNQTSGFADFTTEDPGVTARIRAITTVMGIQGCFRYYTAGSWHRSRYCIYLEPSQTDTAIEHWQFKNCADGHDAD